MISHILCILMETVAMARIKRWSAVSNYTRLVPIFSVVVGGVMVDLNCWLCQKHWEENDEPSPQHTANATCFLVSIYSHAGAHTHILKKWGHQKGSEQAWKARLQVDFFGTYNTCVLLYIALYQYVFTSVCACLWVCVCVCVCVCMCGETAAA